MDAVIVRTGVANTASVSTTLGRVGVACELTTNADRVAGADLVVLPGVGSFGAGMAALREMNMTGTIRERIRAGRATLAICLGMQLLCRRSDESPGVDGLCVIDVEVGRFSTPVRIPQFGWNSVANDGSCTLLRAGYAYYANSYRLTSAPDGWAAAYSYHGERFVAAIEHGNVLACQFHPELSGHWGMSLLRRWAERVGGGGAAC